MASAEPSPEQSNRRRELILKEGEDFLNDEEALALVESFLQREALHAEDVLLSGYNGAAPQTETSSIFAATLRQARDIIASGSPENASPFYYAWQYYPDGEPTVGVYRPQDFYQDYSADDSAPDRYYLKPEASLETALIAKVVLKT